jgi:hypothetical protein
MRGERERDERRALIHKKKKGKREKKEGGFDFTY